MKFSFCTLAVLALVCLMGVQGLSFTKGDHTVGADLNTIFTKYNFTGQVNAYANSSSAFAGNYGFSNVQYGVPFKKTSVFPIGSNTKVMVAVAIYQLIEQGLITSEHDSVANYLNQTDFAAMGYPNMTSYCPKVQGDASGKCQTITFQQLLSMSGGIPVNVDEELLPYPGTLAMTVGASIAAELLFVPGTAYYYSNPSFNLAGYIVQRVSGMPLKDYLATYLWKPAGMTSTYLDMHNGAFKYDPNQVGKFKQFFDNSTRELLGTGDCRISVIPGSVQGAGGVDSTEADIWTFYSKLFNFSPGYVSPFFKNASTLYKLVKPLQQVEPKANKYMWYAQGILVQQDPADPTNPIPQLIAYQGGTLCCTTANIFMPPQANTEHTARMVQVWSNTDAFMSSSKVYEEVLNSDLGNAFNIVQPSVGLFTSRPDSFHLASTLFFALFEPAN